MLAARAGDVAELQQLLKEGAEVDAQSRYGWTALMFACWKGHSEAVEVLLDAGADPNMVSDSVPSQFETVVGHPPTTAMAEAIRNGHLSIAHGLIDRGATIDPLATAMAGGEGDMELLEKMVREGADLNQPSNNAFHASPLCAAAQEGDMVTVAWLLDKGAEPNLIAVGQTALKRAAEADHPVLVQYLLENGADPNIAYGSTSETALYTAVTKHTDRRNYDDNVAVVEVLLDYGADKSHRTSFGRTALDTKKIQRANAIKHLKDETNPETRKRLSDSLAHQDAIIELLEK